MSKFTNTFKKEADRQKMTAAEKRTLKERVTSFMEYHPLPATTARKNAERYVAAQPTLFRIKIDMQVARIMSGAFAVVALVLVPTLAERSVPGDVLYPIKVNFNEEVRSSLTLSTAQKVEWETERLERRIAEVRLLASEGKLTEEFEAEAAEAVQSHASAVQKEIATLKVADAEEAALAEIAFASVLDVQKAKLSPDGVSMNVVTTEQVSENVLVGAVTKAQAEAAATKSTIAPSEAKLRARLEQETTRAFELFATIESDISPQENQEIQRRLEDIERAVAVLEVPPVAEEVTLAVAENVTDVNASSTQEMKEAVTSDVIAVLTGALSDTRKLISFMTDIDVRVHVAVENIVPIVFTKEERYAAINAMLIELDEDVAYLTEAQDVIADADVLLKLEAGLGMIAEVRPVLSASTTELAIVEVEIKNPMAIAKDLRIVVEPLVEAVQVVPEGKEVIEDAIETGSSTPDVVTEGAVVVDETAPVVGSSEDVDGSEVVTE